MQDECGISRNSAGFLLNHEQSKTQNGKSKKTDTQTRKLCVQELDQILNFQSMKLWSTAMAIPACFFLRTHHTGTIMHAVLRPVSSNESMTVAVVLERIKKQDQCTVQICYSASCDPSLELRPICLFRLLLLEIFLARAH